MLDLLYWFMSTAWPVVLAIVHVVLLVGASCHVVLTKRDPRAAFGWVGIIWLTPIVGTVLYFIFGINRIQRKARSLRGNKALVGQLAGKPARHRRRDHAPALGDEALHLIAAAGDTSGG